MDKENIVVGEKNIKIRTARNQVLLYLDAHGYDYKDKTLIEQLDNLADEEKLMNVVKYVAKSESLEDVRHYINTL